MKSEFLNAMNLYDILACPNCRIHVERHDDHLLCSQCGTKFPIVNQIPVMFPDGRIPDYVHHKDLVVRQGYDPWIPKLVIQSLLDNQIVLDVGSGNMSLDDPCIIRMDIMLTDYVDVVGDIHSLPFLPGSLDFVFSLAVMEHLRNPFLASESIYDVLKDGGYIYHECNFIWPYHGFPHHYFNASLQGLESVFEKFTPLRKGVAPYQMPSFALDSIIENFLNLSRISEHHHGRYLAGLLKKVRQHNLHSYDIYFTEETALQLAAGVYFAGYKKQTPQSDIIPGVIRKIGESNAHLTARFPNITNLMTADNIMIWAQREGREQHPEIDDYLASIIPFNKNPNSRVFDRSIIRDTSVTEPRFGAIGFDPDEPIDTQQEKAVAKDFSLTQKLSYVLRKKGLAHLIYRMFLFLKSRVSHS